MTHCTALPTRPTDSIAEVRPAKKAAIIWMIAAPIDSFVAGADAGCSDVGRSRRAVGLQKVMRQPDGDRAVTNRRRHAFDRATPLRHQEQRPQLGRFRTSSVAKPFSFSSICPSSQAAGTDPISTNIADESTASKASPAGDDLHGVRRHRTFGTDQSRGRPQQSGKRSSVQLTIF
jgi:hypothetical protein